ncbi:MAG: hypothetical protein ACE366_18710 [Bradymonadia bacterium]
MPADVKTMTRAQLLRSARINLTITAVSALPVAVLVIFEFKMSMWMKTVFSVAAILALITGIAGLYLGMRGLFRSKNWRPKREDWLAQPFDVEPHILWLSKRIAKELPEASSPSISVEDLDVEHPEDTRSAMDDFLSNHAPFIELFCVVAHTTIHGRALTIRQYLGRPMDEPMALRGRVVLQTPCSAQLNGFPVPNFTEASDAWALLSPLIRKTAFTQSLPQAHFGLAGGHAVLETLATTRRLSGYIGLRPFIDGIALLEKAHP